ncbi:hypothetical protein I6D59_11220 [Staphylococcus aureus]|nr:hypothetical protein [Staphylococcus aureus]MBH4798925.1 hypothetical protein [Staphylococcus aureus]MBH4801784.1 hypothetical protein [Staphylococcus aureus]MBH4806191.1 hypothetical protein [Staphylococcus aureus]MBH4822211.1 hypothetical protein [Staphylococcus aureus]
MQEIKPLEHEELRDLVGSTVERKIYQLIHEYGLSYNQVKQIFKVFDDKLMDHIQNAEISKSKKPLDLTRVQENEHFAKPKNLESANDSAHRLLKHTKQVTSKL